ncbi:MAG: hypothetical protein ACK5KM_03880 [Hyphomicrobiaceae bacterium]
MIGDREGALKACMSGARGLSLCLVVLLAGCAGNADEGPRPVASNAGSAKSCGETRRQLDRLDAQGVPALIEASKSGKKLSDSQRDKVDLYNKLLKNYLGTRCHY